MKNESAYSLEQYDAIDFGITETPIPDEAETYIDTRSSNTFSILGEIWNVRSKSIISIYTIGATDSDKSNSFSSAISLILILFLPLNL